MPFFLSTGVSPDESGDDEDDDEGGGCPVSQSNSIDGYVDFFQHSNRYFRSRHTTAEKFEKTQQLPVNWIFV